MWNISEIQDAWQLASQLHDGQKYGGRDAGQQVEYINHIASVAFEVMAALPQTPGINGKLALHCAILHDTVEDTPVTADEITARFGPEIGAGVAALTKNEALPTKQAQMADSLARIKAQPREVWAVKMADRICNLYAPPFYWNAEKMQKYQEEARLIHRELHEGNSWLAGRLARKINAYAQFFEGR